MLGASGDTNLGHLHSKDYLRIYTAVHSLLSVSTYQWRPSLTGLINDSVKDQGKIERLQISMWLRRTLKASAASHIHTDYEKCDLCCIISEGINQVWHTVSCNMNVSCSSATQQIPASLSEPLWCVMTTLNVSFFHRLPPINNNNLSTLISSGKA